MPKWVWEHPSYPTFPYHAEEMLDSIDATAQSIGKLSLIVQMLDSEKEQKMKMETVIEEIMSSNAIEGEHLNRDSVRSSVRKRLDLSFDLGEDTSTHHTDALTALLLDSSLNHTPLTLKRLHQWHSALFARGYDTLSGDINVGKFRKYDDMEIVSGFHGREKVHYRAVPHKSITHDITQLLDYINTSTEHAYIKSAKAHFWFVTIHPYDDGNGRIARVIADYIFSKDTGLAYKYFSISSAIQLDKKGYYETLEESQKLLYNREYDFTKWIKWHTQTLKNAIDHSLKEVEKVLLKVKFWKKVDTDHVNPRQIKVLNRLLEYAEGAFEGGLNTKKYMSMTKVSKPTAVRDIQALVALGYLKQIEGTAGRNTKYELDFTKI